MYRVWGVKSSNYLICWFNHETHESEFPFVNFAGNRAKYPGRNVILIRGTRNYQSHHSADVGQNLEYNENSICVLIVEDGGSDKNYSIY